MHVDSLLGGSWLVISGVISRVTIVITHNILGRLVNPTYNLSVSEHMGCHVETLRDWGLLH